MPLGSWVARSCSDNQTRDRRSGSRAVRGLGIPISVGIRAATLDAPSDKGDADETTTRGFHAIATDESGRRYQIIEWTEYIQVSSFGKPDEWVMARRKYETDGGEMVNHLDGDDFQVVVIGFVGPPEVLIVRREG